jgi:TolB protein
MTRSTLRTLIVCCVTVVANAADLGVFESSGDVGETPKKGSVEFNRTSGEFRITGGGANMWAATDAFQFVWKKVSGDVALTADVQFVGPGAVAHRKAALMIRQNLEPGSAYADVAWHGDGLTSLQYRSTASAQTFQVVSELKAPRRIRIERRGDRFTLLAGNPGEELKPTAPATVVLQDPVYVGLGVCSHDANILETAIFTNVKLEALSAASPARPRYGSRVSIYDLKTKSAKVVYQSDEAFEAPNWSRDGKYLLSNSRGRLYRIPLDGAAPQPIDLDTSLRANNDHDFSPDGKLIAISASSPTSRQSQVYVASADGSNARLLVSAAPSYFHGWSPDGKFLSIVAQRDGNFDIFRVPAGGGPEERLTSSKGYDDGSDYSPDGKWIYFNSDRSGSWDIWRMPADGAGPGDSKAEQVTSDEFEDWFPHPSPDGKWLLFLSFPKGTTGHNDKLEVQLRMMPLPGATIKPAQIQTLIGFFGGQGTINVNSWSPDSGRFAYVVYETAPR